MSLRTLLLTPLWTGEGTALHNQQVCKASGQNQGRPLPDFEGKVVLEVKTGQPLQKQPGGIDYAHTEP